LVLGSALVINNWGRVDPASILLVMAFCLVCVWSISLGLRLGEARNQARELRVFYLVQLPYLGTPWFSYHLGIGLMVYLGTLQNGRNIQWQLGTDWQTAFTHGDGFFFAINIVPLVALMTLWRSDSSLGRAAERQSGGA
jgi:hypothetical protein